MRNLQCSHVVIIESLSEEDKKTGRELYQYLYDKYNLQGKGPAVDHKPINNLMELRALMIEIKREVINLKYSPILHFEFHGNITEFNLKEEKNIPWSILTDFLREINIAMKNNLIVLISACYGSYIISSDDPTDRSPFLLVAGPEKLIFPDALFKAYCGFYDELFVSLDVINAINILVQKKEKDKFYYITDKFFFQKIFQNIFRSGGKINKIWDDTFKQNFEKEKIHFFMMDLYPEISKYLGLTFKDVIRPINKKFLKDFLL